jgi:GGDEF domain-containing protein
LLNRAGFADVFEELLALATLPQRQSVILLLDLDGFNAVASRSANVRRYFADGRSLDV